MSTTLSIKHRSLIGSNVCKKIRNMGETPGIVYGEKQDPLPIQFSNEDFLVCQRQKNPIFSLECEGKSQDVIVQKIQYDSMGDNIIHVDFLRVSQEKEVTLPVNLEFFGTPEGLSVGGTLNIRLGKISVTCYPKNIPGTIRLDISPLKIAEQLRVKDIPESKDFKINNHPETTLVIVRPPRKAKAAASEDKDK